MLTGARLRVIFRFTLCALLIAALCVPLAGCGSGKPEETTPPPVTESSPEPPPVSESPTPTPSESPSEEPTTPVETPRSVTPVTAIYPNPLDTVSFYDENFFYEMNPAYKVWYVTHYSSELRPEYELLDKAFAHWSSLMNVEYGGMVSAEGNANVYLEMLSQLIADGADGLLIDPDENNFPRVSEILNDAGIHWMPVTTAPRDLGTENAPLLHPYIASPYESTSIAIAGKLFAIKDKLWPDVPYENIGLFIDGFGHGLSAIIDDCTQGLINEWIARTGLENHHLYVNYGQLPASIDNLTGEEFPTFSHYLFFAFTDMGAENLNNWLDLMGIAPNSIIVNITTELASSRELMFIRWENSQQNALEAMMYHPATLRAEAALGALYAFMSETATPETIWPSWINQNDKGGEDVTYATYCIPYFWLEHDNYKHIIKWTDAYSGANFFPEYPLDVISPHDYEQWRGVPEDYALRPVEPEDTGNAED